MPCQVQLGNVLGQGRSRAGQGDRHKVGLLRRRRVRSLQRDLKAQRCDAIIIRHRPGDLGPVLPAHLGGLHEPCCWCIVRRSQQVPPGPLPPPVHRQACVLGDPGTRLIGPVGRRQEFLLAGCLTLQDEPRCAVGPGAQGHFRTFRHAHVLQVRCQEDGGPSGMFRWRDPGFDHHAVGADQCAIVRKQGALQAASGFASGKYAHQHQQGRQHRPHPVRIQPVPVPCQRRRLQAPRLFQQAQAMPLPEFLGSLPRAGRAVGQGRDGPQVGLPVEQARGIFATDGCVSPATLQDEQDRPAQEQERGYGRHGGTHAVDDSGQRDGQENGDKGQERPECLEKGIDGQLPPRGGNLGVERLHAVWVSQSGTFSRAIISSKSGRRRMMSNDDPFTSTSGTSGLAL